MRCSTFLFDIIIIYTEVMISTRVNGGRRVAQLRRTFLSTVAPLSSDYRVQFSPCLLVCSDTVLAGTSTVEDLIPLAEQNYTGPNLLVPRSPIETPNTATSKTLTFTEGTAAPTQGNTLGIFGGYAIQCVAGAGSGVACDPTGTWSAPVTSNVLAHRVIVTTDSDGESLTPGSQYTCYSATVSVLVDTAPETVVYTCQTGPGTVASTTA